MVPRSSPSCFLALRNDAPGRRRLPRTPSAASPGPPQPHQPVAAEVLEDRRRGAGRRSPIRGPTKKVLSGRRAVAELRLPARRQFDTSCGNWIYCGTWSQARQHWPAAAATDSVRPSAQTPLDRASPGPDQTAASSTCPRLRRPPRSRGSHWVASRGASESGSGSKLGPGQRRARYAPGMDQRRTSTMPFARRRRKAASAALITREDHGRRPAPRALQAVPSRRSTTTRCTQRSSRARSASRLGRRRRFRHRQSFPCVATACRLTRRFHYLRRKYFRRWMPSLPSRNSLSRSAGHWPKRDIAAGDKGRVRSNRGFITAVAAWSPSASSRSEVDGKPVHTERYSDSPGFSWGTLVEAWQQSRIP